MQKTSQNDHVLQYFVERMLVDFFDYKYTKLRERINILDYTNEDSILLCNFSYKGEIKTNKSVINTNKFAVILIKHSDNQYELGILNHQMNDLILYNNSTKLLQNYLDDLALEKINTNYFIQELDDMYLDKAIVLRNQVFPDLTKDDHNTLINSLKDDISTMKYYIAIQPSKNKVIGLTGLYNEKDDTDTMCWLGWFCVDEEYRGEGIGRNLLNYTIHEMKKNNKKELHLYTYDSKEFYDAKALYEKYGFKTYIPNFVIDDGYIYMKKQL